jgi:hypothetical protein
MKLLNHLVVILFLISFNYYELKSDIDREKLEIILANISENNELSTALDQIEEFNKNPINLSLAKPSAIAEIPTINLITARKIAAFARSGKYTIKSIADSLGLSEDHRFILELCSFVESKQPKQKLDNFSSRLRVIEQMNTIRGFAQGQYQGSRTDFYQRYQTYYSGHSAGILLTKDKGESSLASFYSGYLSLNSTGINLIVGDFYNQIGLGNVLWSGSGMGKGADVINPAGQTAFLTNPFKSSSEYGFFRGVALSGNILLNDNSVISLKGWFSSVNRSATIDSASNSATSIYTTGLFRTQSELSKLNTLNEKNIGSAVQLTLNKFIIGGTAYKLIYNKMITSESAAQIRGKDALMSSLFSTLMIEDVSFSAEAGRDGSGQMSYKAFSQLVKPTYELIFHFRSFSPEYRTPFGMIFGEASSPNNEVGLYTGLLLKGIKSFKFASYLDFYKSYERTYYVPEPINGIDFLTESLFIIDNQNELKIRTKVENKKDIFTNSEKVKIIYRRSQYYLRGELSHDFGRNLILKGRAEIVFVNFEQNKPNEIGTAGYLEIKYRWFEKLNLSGRLAYFSTSSFETAIYQFEYTAPGIMSTPPLYGNGIRTSINLVYDLFDKGSICLKYSITKKYNVDYMGSSYDLIYGNIDQRFYFQLDLNI